METNVNTPDKIGVVPKRVKNGKSTILVHPSFVGSMPGAGLDHFGDLSTTGVANLFDEFEAFSDPSLRIEKAGSWRVNLNWIITRAGQWSSGPAQEPANIMGTTYTTTTVSGHNHQVTARGYQSLVVTARFQFRYRHAGETSWNVLNRVSPVNLAAYDLGMESDSNHRMSASVSAALNFQEGDELGFLAAILHSIGAWNGANLLSANLVLECPGETASVTTWE